MLLEDSHGGIHLVDILRNIWLEMSVVLVKCHPVKQCFITYWLSLRYLVKEVSLPDLTVLDYLRG